MRDGEKESASVRVTAELRRRIASGELGPGDRVPSTRQIVREWGVAMATASKAIGLLRDEGLVETVVGVGTVVSGGRGGLDLPGRRFSRGSRAVAGGPVTTLDDVVRAAMAIADAEGLAGTTVRRVAQQLDVPTVEIARLVRGRDHLVALMADEAFARHALPEECDGDWRTRLELLSRIHWSMYRSHPWLAHVVSFTRPLLVPHAMAHTEWAMRTVSDDLDPDVVVHVAATVTSFVRGTAVNLEREADARQDTGLTSDEWMRNQGDVVVAAVRDGSFPILASVWDREDVAMTLDSLFEFGLQRMLDGIAALVQGRAAAG
ncbi:TetR/AcrR family transcriptional regulator C-terminal domain-containing protein [Mumia zhuanghuii]|uniref:TetR/AcrR family transcriptional regulator C-terminal domain-containing protein n=1 Tax=Mumia zhuanghuii TaxID=2585211 RepID=UPI001E2DF5D2|nr:TetR/AcrR family transcriptional regulator C-terminal domain-containing protein [Mumia zhuanghuii]